MPTVDIPDKICPHCGGTKWILTHQTYKDKVYTIYMCRIKVDERSKKWNAENKEKRSKKQKKARDKVKHTQKYIEENRKRASEYYKKYPEKVYAHTKNSRLKNPEKYNFASKLRKKEYVKTLADYYIKQLIIKYTKLSSKDIPQELIDLKRKQLQQYKIIRSQSKINKNESENTTCCKTA